jgi:hypothetical protein
MQVPTKLPVASVKKKRKKKQLAKKINKALAWSRAPRLSERRSKKTRRLFSFFCAPIPCFSTLTPRRKMKYKGKALCLALALLVAVNVAALPSRLSRGEGVAAGKRTLLEWKWSPGYIASTMADAFADTLRAKAAGGLLAAKQPQPVPTFLAAQALPEKSKDFRSV